MTSGYIVTGPTSGMGRFAALELAERGVVVLVGRDRERLDAVQGLIARNGQRAVSVICDLSDIASVRRAAADIVALNLPIAGLLNNAGVQQLRPTKNARGWDMSFATNHLGPFALTEALTPHLPDGCNVLFVASAVEDPERKPAKAAGFRGGRYVSAEASARGEWLPGGVDPAGLRRICDVKAGNFGRCAGLGARDAPAAHQCRGTGLYARYRPGARRRPCRALSRDLSGPAAQAVHALSKHAAGGGSAPRAPADRYIGADRRLLRRARRAHDRVADHQRPVFPRAGRRRDACGAGAVDLAS